MDIESVHKYIALNKLANGNVEVLFSGQPCLTITESMMIGNVWKINPVFAKLVYGANIFEDIPQCTSGFDSMEEAVAAGLIKLNELGAFKSEVDLPEDSYAATLNQIDSDVRQYAMDTNDTVTEAFDAWKSIMGSIKNNTFIGESYKKKEPKESKSTEKDLTSAIKKNAKFMAKDSCATDPLTGEK